MRIPTGGSLFSLYASFSATFTLLQQAFYQFVPVVVRQYVYQIFKQWFSKPVPPRPDLFTLIIEERDGMNRNEIFNACQIYLCSKMNDSTNILKVSRAPNEDTMNYKLAKGVVFSETFEGIHLRWSFHCLSSSSDTPPFNPRNHDAIPPIPFNKTKPKDPFSQDTDTSYFSLAFNKEHKKKVCNSYLPFVVKASQDIEREGRVLRLCDCNVAYGSHYPGMGKSKHSVKMTHPFTFEKLAMAPEMKKLIMEDLDRFVKRKEFYRRVGKPWKRGYLLYGPPGTGKSSLIAAMANHLRFDIYDLQLGSMHGYSSLRDLLLWLPSQSIIVVEDIDRTQGFPKRRLIKKPPNVEHGFDDSVEKAAKREQLAPLLNFVDGLWSCCGDERLIVLTTNHKEKLDPALLRPGRMDMHVHLSYLTMPGFMVLAYNYLQVFTDHPLFGDIESLLKTVNATPAEVAEELMRSEDVDTALGGVVELLKGKKSQAPNPETPAENVGDTVRISSA